MKRILLSLVMFLCAAASAFSQTQANTGQIEGFITDPAGANVAGATVKIRNTETNQTRETTTNEEGFYRASLLQIGSYEIIVESSNFAAYTQSGITLSTGQILTINPRLAVAGLQDEVTVVADANLVESSRTNLSRAVNQVDVTELPNLSSSELNFAFLQPFVSGDPPREYEAPRLDFGGLSRRLNYQVDGFQNSTAQQKAFRVIIFSTSALQETQIATYGATAESGRTGGPGVINNIIKSGTNKFSGTVRYQTYRKAFNALPFGALPNNEPNGNTFVGAIGGPIKKNKLFFFASYEASKRAFPNRSALRVLPHKRTWHDSVLPATKSASFPATSTRSSGFSNSIGNLTARRASPFAATPSANSSRRAIPAARQFSAHRTARFSTKPPVRCLG